MLFHNAVFVNMGISLFVLGDISESVVYTPAFSHFGIKLVYQIPGFSRSDQQIVLFLGQNRVKHAVFVNPELIIFAEIIAWKPSLAMRALHLPRILQRIDNPRIVAVKSPKVRAAVAAVVPERVSFLSYGKAAGDSLSRDQIPQLVFEFQVVVCRFDHRIRFFFRPIVPTDVFPCNQPFFHGHQGRHRFPYENRQTSFRANNVIIVFRRHTEHRISFFFRRYKAVARYIRNLRRQGLECYIDIGSIYFFSRLRIPGYIQPAVIVRKLNISASSGRYIYSKHG
jgi:hypothetical protein